MRSYEPLVPPKDQEVMHPTVYELFRQIDRWNRHVSLAIGNISRNVSPDQSQEPPVTPPGVTDHGALGGLVPTLNPDGTIADYNDDHTQYALLFGRPGGQELYGSRPSGTVAWEPRGNFLLAKATSGGASSWTTNAAETLANAPTATGIILVMSTRTFASLAGGETNYHTILTDTGGNTWTKLKEYSSNYSGAATLHTSLWFCLVTSALTAGVNTLTATFSTADHIRYSAEAYSFDMQPGLSVTLVSYDTDASAHTATGNTPAASMSLSALSGETLFVRAMGDQPTSGGPPIGYTPTAGFTAFASDHTGSTNTGAGGFGQSVRGEFAILNGTGATSSPFYLQDGDIHTTASIFGGIQIVSTSSPVTLTPVTGFTPITGGFITSIRTTDETAWNSIAIQTSAPAGRLVFLVFATHSNGAGSGGGNTNYHTGITDTQSNTWTKLKEFTTSFFAGTEEQTVSLWYCKVAASLTAGSDTLSASLAMSIAKKSIESHQFTMSPDATVSLAASTTGGDDDAFPDALALSSVSNPAIYIRGMAVHQSPGDGPTAYTPSAGYTAFTTDHTNSTNTSSEATYRNTAARGEFLITSAASSTTQPVTSSALADTASVFCAITLTSSAPPPNAYLRLGAADLSDASQIVLSGRDITFAAGIGGGDFIFDPLGEGGYTGTLDFDSIAASDKTYVFPNASGTIALTSDLAAYLKLDGSNDPMTGDLNFGDNIAVVFGTGNDAEIYYNATNLLIDPAAGAGTGSVLISSTIRSSGTYAARQHILQVAHSALQGGGTSSTAQTVSLGTITLTDAGLSAGQYGQTQGLDITVTNANTTKAGLPKTPTVPYVLSLIYNNSLDVIGSDAAALRITGTFTGTSTNVLQTSTLAIVNGISTSTGALTGVQGCQFQAHNSSSAGGDARGFTGYGNLTSATATGNGTGVYGYGSNSGNGGSALSVSFFANTVGPADSRQHYDIIGSKHAIHGAVYITTATQNLKTSTPATHLTLITASAVPDNDLFVGNEAEIDGTLWIDKVGDALVLAEGGNVVLGTTTGTKIGTAANQLLGFHGVTPTAQDTGWSVTNVTTDRTYDANSTSIDELADVLGTLITQLIAKGTIGA